MDFYKIAERVGKNKNLEVFPDFKVANSKDLMIRGNRFYAIWDEKAGLWSTNEYDVARLVDEELEAHAEKLRERCSSVSVKYMSSYSSKSWSEFKNYVSKIGDNAKQLDTHITFSNTESNKKDYVSRKLSYPLKKGKHKSYDEIMNTLYSSDERKKIEWAIGAIISGDSKNIQKFLVFYGDPGTGKSTVLEIIQRLFEGYYTIFEAKSLTSSNNIFSTEAFKSNPLIAIQHDGDLSKIEDNSKLNSIISHEEIIINEKYKNSYPMRVNCFLFMATNKPVKITDAKAGLIRRLIDVRPTGNKLDPDKYYDLMDQIPYELGAIAEHCLAVYKDMGKDYYNKYKPIDMMYKTDPFFNFVEGYSDIFEREGGVTLKQAYSMYKQYCDETNADYKMQMYKFREELKNYFKKFEDFARVNDVLVRSYYSEFDKKKFDRKSEAFVPVKKKSWINLKEQASIFDEDCMDLPAQYANENETPTKKWDSVKTILSDIDTTKLHYIRVPENHIVIDFDLKDDDGKKSLEKNLAAAEKFPKTYVETSKSGNGLHLHYIYDGDVSTLSRVYDDNIEVKVFNGNSSLRRKLIKCNDIQIATINSGLPLREVKGDRVVNFEAIKSEKVLRSMIKKNLNKEYHGATKPSIDFIYKLLNDAYESGMHYDVTDLRQAVLIFAANSNNRADYCISLVNQMKFRSEEPSIEQDYIDGPIIFYDVEVFINLFLINWKKEGEGNPIVRMINPTPSEVEELVRHKLVGYNCRRYDNHILHARIMGYTNEQLYKLSQKIVTTKKGEYKDCFFGEAYNYSYTDIYDYTTTKQSLKKWEIQLGIHHKELGLPWDEPVPEERWVEVAEYCDNDVVATEAVWNATKSDFKARQMLVGICRELGMDACENDTTNSLTTKIIFGRERHPELIYTDLSETFPGYEYIAYGEDKKPHNMYKGIDVGFGGYVYSEPGMYTNVALLDIASQHPHSIIAMDCFGEYTKNFKDLVDARIAIKHKDFNKARKMLNGALAPYLNDEDAAEELSNALKIPINSVYGLTSASFPNPFKDPRNVNNIVALRGALFMVTLQEEIIKRGFRPIHFKTDSVKIADSTPEIISFCMEFAKKYGYTFEHEATYSKICLVNGSTYIAKHATVDQCYKLYSKEYVESSKEVCKKNKKYEGQWTATAAQFQQPYVFKTLFSHEPIVLKDMCETKEVKGSLYLDFNENLPEDEHDYRFIGKVGEFCPIKPGCGGARLLRFADDKYSAAVGTKGYLWLESEMVEQLNKEDCIDKSYYIKLVDEAVKDISSYGDFEWFISDQDKSPCPLDE